MSSVFTSRVTSTIEIPNADGATVTFRKLAPRHLEAAAKESQRRSFEAMKELGGPAELRQWQALVADVKVSTEVRADPLLVFDRLTVIEKGVLSWTFDEAVGRESFDELDDDTAEFLARAILRLAKPALFQTVDEAEAAQVKS